MTQRTVVVRLNKQQLELLDRSVVELSATDRGDVLRRALRGFHQLEATTASSSKSGGSRSGGSKSGGPNSGGPTDAAGGTMGDDQ
jgi:hypothetical protein